MLGFNKFRCPFSWTRKRSWYYHLYKLLKHQPHIHTNLVIVAPVNDLARDGTRPLTHLPSDKMAAIFADNIFKCMFLNETDKISTQISMKFVHKSPIQYPSIGCDNALAPNRRKSITWTNSDPVHWRIYAVLRGDEVINRHSADYISILVLHVYLGCRVLETI